MYSISNFSGKNSGIIKRDISIMMYESSHPLLKILFPEGKHNFLNLILENRKFEREQIRIRKF